MESPEAEYIDSWGDKSRVKGKRKSEGDGDRTLRAQKEGSASPYLDAIS